MDITSCLRWGWLIIILAIALIPRDNRLALAFSGSLKKSTSNLQLRDEIDRTIRKEYASFFSYLDRNRYSPEVQFTDPLNNFKGIDKYKNNIDMLAGRTLLGSFLFCDSSLALHNLEFADDISFNFQTRWTLQATFKALPNKPRVRFTGISQYTVDEDGIITSQADFWDSINLDQGQYRTVGKDLALKDFFAQISSSTGAQMNAVELPYELLRRAGRYEVRRYPPCLLAQTKYESRPEGYDRLGSYATGSNEGNKRLQYYSPTLMRIEDISGKRQKTMSWPMEFVVPGNPLPDPTEQLPEPMATIQRISKQELVVAVSVFQVAATEPVVRGYTAQLLSDVGRDGMTALPYSKNGGLIVAQYDALFSLNKRRNEVWVELENHFW